MAGGATLVERSPFIPSGFNASGARARPGSASAASGEFTFHGIYRIGETYWFLVKEPGSRDSRWLEEGRDYEGLQVRSYDTTTKTLTLLSNNAEHQVVLVELNANPAPMPVQGQARPTTRKPTAPKPTVRRTIRPSARSNSNPQKDSSPAPPAWLEKLREEAAQRRAQAEKAKEDSAPKP